MEEEIKPIPSAGGGPVTGDHFFGREEDFRRFREKLKKGRGSIMIPGPRRTGKSSFIKEYQIRHQGETPLFYIYVQECTNTPELCRKIIERISEQLQGLNQLKPSYNSAKTELNRLLGISKKFKPMEWTFKEQLDEVAPLIRQLSKEGCVIAFDEFADCILHMEKNDKKLTEVRTFLLYLRGLVQEHGCRFVLCSSINLPRTIERMGFDDLVTDFDPFHLTPLSEPEILRFFKGLLLHHDVRVAEECDVFVREKMEGGNHYHIQLFVNEIRNAVKVKDAPLTLAALKEGYERILEKQNPNLSLFHSRIAKEGYYGKQEAKLALKLLAHLSHQPMTLGELVPMVKTDKPKAVNLLYKLIDDAYLIRKGETYAFFSPFLKDWWRTHYGHET